MTMGELLREKGITYDREYPPCACGWNGPTQDLVLTEYKEQSRNKKYLMKPNIIIQIDTAEQKPFDFQAMIDKDKTCCVTIERVSLLTGDYSVKIDSPDPLDHIALERKSLADLYSTLGSRRNDFEAEFQRMAVLGYGAVVIEADLKAIADPNAWLKHPTRLAPKSVLATLIAWSQRYHVHVWTCPDRDYATILAYRLLTRWARDHHEHRTVRAKSNGSLTGRKLVAESNPESL